MADFPLVVGTQLYETAGVDTSTSAGTSVTMGNGSKGSYAQLTSATARDAMGFWVFVGEPSSNSFNPAIIDIAIGASSSEVIVVPDLRWSGSDENAKYVWYCPVPIPAGTRIAARGQVGSGTPTYKIYVLLVAPSFHDQPKAGGVALAAASATPGVATNSKGSWVQVIASTASEIDYLIVQHDLDGAREISASYRHLIDIGIGASSSEQVLIPDLAFGLKSTGGELLPIEYEIPVRIPSGSRLSTRASESAGGNNSPGKVRLLGFSGGFSMADFSYFETAGVDSSTTAGTTVTSSSSANTKGSWTQLVAATTLDAAGFWIETSQPAVPQRYRLDIGVGGSGSEVVLVPDVCFSPIRDTHVYRAFVPVPIPAGTRLSARVQSDGTSKAIKVHLLLAGPALVTSQMSGPVVTYGLGSNTSNTAVDPGGTANTKGSWVELTSSTTYDINYLILNVDLDTADATNSASWLVDIGMTPQFETQQVLVPDVGFYNSANKDQVTPVSMGFPVHLPAGTRLAARSQCSVSGSGDRSIFLQMIGVT